MKTISIAVLMTVFSFQSQALLNNIFVNVDMISSSKSCVIKNNLSDFVEITCDGKKSMKLELSGTREEKVSKIVSDMLTIRGYNDLIVLPADDSTVANSFLFVY